MKILRINTSNAGGASQTCLRINQTLQNNEIDSKVLVLHQAKQTPHTFNYFDTLSFNLFTKIKYSFAYRWDRWQKKNILKSLKKGAEAYAFAHSIYSLHKHPLVQEANLIHLHWISNFINFKVFFTHVQKPIVWTLHDLLKKTYTAYLLNTPINYTGSNLSAHLEDVSQVHCLKFTTQSMWLFLKTLKKVL